MKKLFLFLFLSAGIFAQQTIDIKVAGDTTTLKTLDGLRPVLLLQYGGSTFNRTGGGLFQAIDSTYEEGSYAFDHAWTGMQWARIGLIDPEPVLNSLKVNTLSLDSLVSTGIDVFTTTAVTDSVVISGATTDDIYFVTGNLTSAIDQQDILQWQALTDTLVVHRMASGESALKYGWIRIRTH